MIKCNRCSKPIQPLFASESCKCKHQRFKLEIELKTECDEKLSTGEVSAWVRALLAGEEGLTVTIKKVNEE